MKKIIMTLCFAFALTSPVFSADIEIGSGLTDISIEKKGILLPDYEIKNDSMVFKKDGKIKYRPWNTQELRGKIVSIYHLAARNGIDEINKPFIDALINANLPQKLPDSQYKTATILNMSDAVWGTAGIASGRFEKSQKKHPYACFIIDADGTALKTWGLKKKESAVIILDEKGKVLFFKEGKLSEKEIASAVTMIKEALKNIMDKIP